MSQTFFTVIDTELTGLDARRDELLSVGAVRMKGTCILVGQTLYRTVRPRVDAWHGTVAIHGIRPVDVHGAPELAQVMCELADFSAGTIMVGHRVEVDRQFLERARELAGSPPLPRLWVDTARVAKWLASDGGRIPGAESQDEGLDLVTLARKEGISVLPDHHALTDALVTAQVWQRQLTRLLRKGVVQVRDLVLVGLI
jgi:DNA polymerase-3 subunit epsilon